MLRRYFAPLTIALLGLALVLTGQAAEPTPAPNLSDAQIKELANKQEFLQRQWKDFAKNLLIIAQKFEKSSRTEDQEKAKTIFKVLELAEKEGVENKFTILVRTLSKKGGSDLNEFQAATTSNVELVKVLDHILQMLMNDDDLGRLREERIRLEAYLKELKGIIDDQKITRAITENKKADNDQLSKEQKDLANRTDSLGKKMDGKGDKANGGGQPKDDKAAPKPEGNNKNEGKGEEKKDTGEAKATDKKPEGNKPEPKEGDGSKGKGGEPKDGEGSKGKGGEPKDGESGSKPKGDPNAKPMPMDKPSDPAASKNKQDGKADGKASEGGMKGSEGEGKPSDSQGGQPSQSPPSQGKPGGQPSQGGGQSPPMPPQQTPGADNIKKAVPDQENASEQIQGKKNDDAAKKQDEALDKLTKAREELEKKLKQLREEELERLLANLEARVSRMLAMQKEVYANTTALDGIAKKAEDKKLPKSEYQRSQQQSDREGDIVAEADKTLDLLRTEGSAVAFPGVLEEVRKDMIRVKERLNVGIVNEDTQEIEKDIIEALTQMQEALKKAQQDMKDGKPGQPGQPGQPQDQKLLDEIAELKMIKQLQVNVNRRTNRYGEKYKGEQADDPIIKGDLKDLSGKQEKIEQMVKDIVEGRNK